MSYQEENLFYEQSTNYTMEEEQIKLQIILSTTTSSNKKTYLETVSRYGILIGDDDNMDSKLESLSFARINNPFSFNDINNFNIYDSSEKEDDFNFDNLPNSVYNIINNNIVHFWRKFQILYLIEREIELNLKIYTKEKIMVKEQSRDFFLTIIW